MELTEKRIKEILTEQREEYQRYVGVLRKDFDSKIQLIGEQYSDIKGALDSHSEMFGSLLEDVQIIKTDVQFLKGALKKKADYEEFAALEKRVALLEAKMKK